MINSTPVHVTKSQRPRMAIIGGGSSGLITLKTALEMLPGWEIVCYEKTDRLTGCWGNPYPGFVSTSTKFTTQFSCFPIQDAGIAPDGGRSRSEFFRDDEYGKYLTQFVETYRLRPHIKLHHQVEQLKRISIDSHWCLTVTNTQANQPQVSSECFDCVVIATGLAAQVKAIETPFPMASVEELNRLDGEHSLRNQTIVVFGGGESAVDYADRLSRPELGNRVYLSLRSGVRVSPRYHPIRGVPSDFLRNRLLLSIHPDLRNWIGQRFVVARIRHQELFEKWFVTKAAVSPHAGPKNPPCEGSDTCLASVKKEWAYRLTMAAKDDLFNMFHNKSDDFLDAVAAGRITIIGPPTDDQLTEFYEFNSVKRVVVNPDCILPAIGYRSTLNSIAGESVRLQDFYLGCCHQTHANLFLVGFARPIIGNIPTISEVQAQYVCGLVSERYRRPADIVEANVAEQASNLKRFSQLNLDMMYPVEMFAYCDRLAQLMSSYPSLRNLRSLRSWWRLQLTPATTMHYSFEVPEIRARFDRSPVYMPMSLVFLLLMLKPVDFTYRMLLWIRSTCGRSSAPTGVVEPRS